MDGPPFLEIFRAHSKNQFVPFGGSQLSGSLLEINPPASAKQRLPRGMLRCDMLSRSGSYFIARQLRVKVCPYLGH